MEVLNNFRNFSVDLTPTKSTGVGIYLLIIGRYVYWLSMSPTLSTCLVLLSFFLNLLVIIVIVLRPQKKHSTDIFIIALAISDILFAVAIHPMLIATSFGANVEVLFSSTGNSISGQFKVCKLFRM